MQNHCVGCLLKVQMKAMGTKNCNFQPFKSIREAVQKPKGGFYKVNGANNKEVVSVESFNAVY